MFYHLYMHATVAKLSCPVASFCQWEMASLFCSDSKTWFQLQWIIVWLNYKEVHKVPLLNLGEANNRNTFWGKYPGNSFWTSFEEPSSFVAPGWNSKCFYALFWPILSISVRHNWTEQLTLKVFGHISSLQHFNDKSLNIL